MDSPMYAHFVAKVPTGMDFAKVNQAVVCLIRFHDIFNVKKRIEEFLVANKQNEVILMP
jgi:hypothetical protein